MKRFVALVAVFLAAPVAAAAQAPRADSAGDVSAGYSIMRDSASLTFQGFRLSGAKNLSNTWAAVVELGAERNGSGIYTSSSGTHTFTYTDRTLLGGIRLRRSDGSSTTPFFQVLGGYFGRSGSPSSQSSYKGQFAVRAEGGMDFRFSEHAAFRVGGGWTFLGSGVRYMNQIGANVGFAYIFGKR